jgi:hypothetical protein
MVSILSVLEAKLYRVDTARLPRSAKRSGRAVVAAVAGMGRCSKRNKCVAHVAHLQSELPKPRHTTLAPGLAPISAAYSCSHQMPHRLTRIRRACIVGCNQHASGGGRVARYDGGSHAQSAGSERAPNTQIPARSEANIADSPDENCAGRGAAEHEDVTTRHGRDHDSIVHLQMAPSAFNGPMPSLPSPRTERGICPNRPPSTRASPSMRSPRATCLKSRRNLVSTSMATHGWLLRTGQSRRRP